MKKGNKVSRRSFLQKSSLGVGIGMAGSSAFNIASAGNIKLVDRSSRLPREVWIASITLERLSAQTYEEMIEKVFARMENVLAYQPDIICLPELFATIKLYNVPRPSLDEVAEKPLGKISGRFAEWAKKNNCYVICPISTKEDGYYYNAAVVIDRSGKLMGEYRKTYLTEGEMMGGYTCGPIGPPVFKTDFGIIGVQICFDMNWDEGWKRLREKGAEIIFWPSAFPAGIELNTVAWRNKCVVVSSTRDEPTRICDITGEDVDSTGRFEDWICASVNLEKAFIHIWPYVRKYNEIRAKYGRRIRIRSIHDEGWTVMESFDPDLKVADVMKEFEIKTFEEHIKSADRMQMKNRR